VRSDGVAPGGGVGGGGGRAAGVAGGGGGASCASHVRLCRDRFFKSKAQLGLESNKTCQHLLLSILTKPFELTIKPNN
jgi:hypothetical protein